MQYQNFIQSRRYKRETWIFRFIGDSEQRTVYKYFDMEGWYVEMATDNFRHLEIQWNNVVYSIKVDEKEIYTNRRI